MKLEVIVIYFQLINYLFRGVESLFQLRPRRELEQRASCELEH